MHKLLPEVQAFVKELELSTIPAIRQDDLQKLTKVIQSKIERAEAININFICTHNSRRSQLCQVWAQTFANYFGIDGVQAFSGGTEATAFHPNAIEALKNSGFQITVKEDRENPIYGINALRESRPLPYFSKVYSDKFNKTPFTAVLTCSDAEKNCPFIPEADARFTLKFEDPKKADGTAKEKQVYKERNKEIATEMLYVFSNLKSKKQ